MSADTAVPGQRMADRAPAQRPSLHRRDLAAIGCAGAGALLVFLSFVLDWASVGQRSSGSDSGLTVGVDDIPTWGTAYVLGVMVLVAMFVAVMLLPSSIGRAARVLGIGWAVGIAGVVAAIVVRFPDAQLRNLLGAWAETVSWRSGLFCALGAVALMIVAFASACPSLRDIAAIRPATDR